MTTLIRRPADPFRADVLRGDTSPFAGEVIEADPCPACGQGLTDAAWSWTFDAWVHQDCLYDCGEA